MSWDLLAKTTCNHYVSSQTYSLRNCPRCVGRGYYFDVNINAFGRLAQVSNSDKLIQALEKAFRESKRLSGWGFDHKALTGLVHPDTIRTILRTETVAALSFLVREQQANVRRGVQIPNNELVSRIGDLEVVQGTSEPREWTVRVKIVTAARKEVEVAVPIRLTGVSSG